MTFSVPVSQKVLPSVCSALSFWCMVFRFKSHETQLEFRIIPEIITKQFSENIRFSDHMHARITAQRKKIVQNASNVQHSIYSRRQNAYNPCLHDKNRTVSFDHYCSYCRLKSIRDIGNLVIELIIRFSSLPKTEFYHLTDTGIFCFLPAQ